MSAQIHQLGAHFEALDEVVFVAPFETFFFSIKVTLVNSVCGQIPFFKQVSNSCLVSKYIILGTVLAKVLYKILR